MLKQYFIKNKKNIYYIIGSIVILWFLFNAILRWYNSNSIQKTNINDLLKIETFDQEDYNQKVILHDNLNAYKYQKVIFDIDRNVEQIFVENGDKVSKGQVLALIGNIKERKGLMDIFNKLQYNIHQYSKKFKYSSQKKILVAESSQTLNSLMSQFRSIEHLMKQLAVVAKFDGIVINSILTANHSTPINKIAMEIIDDNKLIVQLKIDESYFEKISKHSKVIIVTKNNQTINGKIKSIDKSINHNTGTFNIDIIVNNEEQKLLHGMQVKIIIESIPIASYLVPDSAIIKNNNDEYIIKLIDENNIVKDTIINILDKEAFTKNSWIYGISFPSIKIITFGAEFFQNGSKIENYKND